MRSLVSMLVLTAAVSILLNASGAPAEEKVAAPANCSFGSSSTIRSASAIAACPFCTAPSLTLTEQFFDADAVVLVEWSGGEPATQSSPGSADYKILEVKRTRGVELAKGDPIHLPRYRAGHEGDLFVLMGTKGRTLDWSSTLPVTAESYKYMAEAPSPDIPTVERLEYFLKFLEHPDEMVALDAYGEFANAPYQDITPLSDKMPREELRKWVTDPQTPVTRLGLYGLLLGLCGTDEDADAMKGVVIRREQDYRLGIDGIMSGYLLLTGDKGLDVIDETKLASAILTDENGEEYEIPFSETYAAMQAIRFMWTYGDERIAKPRLLKSMRLLLNRPGLADLVIADLSRWKDWSVADTLFKMYTKEEFDVRSIKIAIVKFLHYCSRDVPKDAEEGAEEPEHVRKAKAYLQKLKEIDPKTVSEAKRYLIR